MLTFTRHPLHWPRIQEVHSPHLLSFAMECSSLFHTRVCAFMCVCVRVYVCDCACCVCVHAFVCA